MYELLSTVGLHLVLCIEQTILHKRMTELKFTRKGHDTFRIT